MKFLKLFSLTLLLALFAGFAFFNVALAQKNENLGNVLLEYETDEVTTKNLGIEELTVLPGEGGYWWQKTKENLGLFFTFDKEKKVEKLEQIANRRLLEAKKLTENGNENAANHVAEALEKYKTRMAEVMERLRANPNIREKVLEKFDANQLRHQQVLSTVVEKLKNKISDDQINKIKKIKKENAINWYNTNKENLGERLEKAVENNGVGSKFKHLKNIATLEELSEDLPESAKVKIEAVKAKAEKSLSNKLENMSPEDGEKLEKYLNNIKTADLVKQKFIGNLKESEVLPSKAKKRIENAFTNYTNQLRNRFQNLNDDQKEKFLDQFNDKLRSHPTNLDFLQNIDAPNFRERIQKLLEVQQEGIKEKIQNTTDFIKLRSLEKNLSNFPALRREVQEQQKKIIPKPNLNLRPYQINPTDNRQ